MPQAIIQTFIFGVCGLFVIALGFFINRWVSGLDGTLEKLNSTMDKLAGSLDSLDGRINKVEWHIENHKTVIERIGSSGCSNPSCPFVQYATDTRFGARTRKTDEE